MKKCPAAAIALILALGALSSAHASSYSYTSLTYPDAFNTVAFDINDRGRIVGSYFDAGGAEHGFVATRTFGVEHGFVATRTFGAEHGFVATRTFGVEHGFVADPVPVPASLFLLAPGLIGLAVMRRRLQKIGVIHRASRGRVSQLPCPFSRPRPDDCHFKSSIINQFLKVRSTGSTPPAPSKAESRRLRSRRRPTCSTGDGTTCKVKRITRGTPCYSPPRFHLPVRGETSPINHKKMADPTVKIAGGKKRLVTQAHEGSPLPAF